MKKKIAVIFGGCSDEYAVSLQSAAAVIKNIDKEKYNVLPVGITKKGEWLYYEGDVNNIRNDSWQSSKCVKALISPDRVNGGLFIANGNDMERIWLDAVFPVMHGKNGEDGTIQGLVELSGIALIGCGTLSSASCMDKHKAHIIVKSAGIKVPEACLANNKDNLEEAYNLIKRKGKAVVKPVRSGSSLGVRVIDDISKLKNAVETAFEFDNRALVEEFVEGNEFGCAVIGENNVITGEVDEIELKKDAFDFNEKYNPESTIIRLPANVSDRKREEIKNAAVKIYKALGCDGFARVDVFLTHDGEIVFNEVNTIPGFTENSRFPNMMKAAGYSMKDTVQMIIDKGMGGE